MTARRLVTSLVLAALMGNVSVLAGTSASLGSASEGQAFTLVSLRHETVGAVTRIQVESSAPPLYTVFRPSDRLIIVDLPGCEGSQLQPEYAVNTPLVDSIAVRQSNVGVARRAMRLEVAVSPNSQDRSNVSGNTLTLEVAPDTDASAQLNRGDARRERQQAETGSPGIYVYPTPISPAKAADLNKAATPVASRPTSDNAPARPAALRAATLIRDVRAEANAGGVRIVVDADGSVQYKDFVLTDPWRVVVDITGVRSAIGNRVTPVGASSIDRLRVGQPSSNVVRLVLDTKSKVNYQVVREGQQLVITVGNPGASASPRSVSPLERSGKTPDKPVVATNASKAEVKVAGERIENNANTTSDGSGLIAQARQSSSGARPPQVGSSPNRSLPLTTQPAPAAPRASTSVGQPSAINRSSMDVQRQTGPVSTAHDSKAKGLMAFCEPNYVGGLISFDLRAGVDIRDMLRFISQQYGVNFIVDKSVSSVPVDIRVTDVPWNQVMDSVLRANRLGAVCESNGKMIRIATLGAIREEEEAQRAIAEAQDKAKPLITKIIHLKYARAAGSLSAAGSGKSASGGGGGGGLAAGGAGGAGQGSLMSIVNTRLSPRGRVEIDSRTNSLIITDLPEYTQVIEEMISKLDRPEPQVEIEARIVIANRNFLRDIGVELASGVTGRNGRSGVFETSPATFNNGGLSSSQQGAGGSGGSSGGGSGTGSGSGSGGASTKQLGANLLGPFANGSLTAAANSVLSLTTGVLGTSIISAALSAQETKGQIRTIASPRVTTTDNKTAEIVNGVQIPVQTVSNNTITTTFVTAALRLEITPQIIEESGQVLMHVVAENNTVNFSLANQFNNGTPGIDTQSAESTVLVADGGTTVMGGINTDSESHTLNRTPGLSKIPLLGEMFKRRTVRRDAGEILFFLTPRIIKYDGLGGPGTMQRSSNDVLVNPVVPQRATNPPSVSSAPTTAKAQPQQSVATEKKTGGQQ